MGKKLTLFEEDGNEDNSNNNNDGVFGKKEIKINEEFARRYEHNKKREDLQRLEELKKKGMVNESDDSETSSDEENDDVSVRKKNDLKFLDALIKVRKQDPLLKSKDAKLFSSDSENEDDADDNDDNDKKEKKKKIYLKDVNAKYLIEDGPEFEEDEEEDEGKRVKSYFEEQEDARREFLKSLAEAENEESEGGELLKLKEGGRKDDDDEDEVIEEKLDEYFGKDDDKLDENEKFLKEYFKNRLWEANETGVGVGEDGKEKLDELSDDEEEIEKQEDYERGFNFRFEENATDRVLGFSRKVEGSVRKKTNTRQLQRERKEERIAEAEIERREELKRLKNLKKKEMNEKLQKIREIAGIDEDGVCPLDEDDLEEEFDPEEHDRKMKLAFGDEYYKAEDVNPEFRSDDDEVGDDFEKPDFDKEDELLGLPNGWDDMKGSSDGFISARERILKMKPKNGGEDEQAEGIDDVVPEEGKRKRKKRKPSEVEKAVREELMEEYYKLDYEDTIGDLKTRFKYKPVKAKRFGLRTEEILALEDDDLNQFVSIKKLAPYREKEWKVPHTKLQQQKEKAKEAMKKLREKSLGGKRKRRDDDQSRVVPVEENQKPKTEDLTAETDILSRGSKRRRRKAEFKIDPERVQGYGEPPSKRKKKI